MSIEIDLDALEFKANESSHGDFPYWPTQVVTLIRLLRDAQETVAGIRIRHDLIDTLIRRVNQRDARIAQLERVREAATILVDSPHSVSHEVTVDWWERHMAALITSLADVEADSNGA